MSDLAVLPSVGRLAVAAAKAIDYGQAGECVAMLERRAAVKARYSREWDFLGFDAVGDLSPADAEAMLRALAPIIAPAPVALVVAELARLKLVTKAKAEEPAITDAAMSVMAEELSAWPGDVVRAACRSWARNSTWWPSLAELNAECDWRAKRRRALADRLRRAAQLEAA